MTADRVKGGLRGLVRGASLGVVGLLLVLVLRGALLLLLLLDGVVVGLDARGSRGMAVVLRVGGARGIALLLLLLLLLLSGSGSGSGGGSLILAQRSSPRLNMTDGAKIPQVISDGSRPVGVGGSAPAARSFGADNLGTHSYPLSLSSSSPPPSLSPPSCFHLSNLSINSTR